MAAALCLARPQRMSRSASGSMLSEDGLPLLHERHDALDLVGTTERRMKSGARALLSRESGVFQSIVARPHWVGVLKCQESVLRCQDSRIGRDA